MADIKLNVPIPDKLLDDTAKKRIKQLERKLTNLEKKLARRDDEIFDLKKTIEDNQGTIDAANRLVQDIKDIHDLRTDDDEPPNRRWY